MTQSNQMIYKALFISLTLHTIFVCGSYWMKLPAIKKAKEKRVEITYKRTATQQLDIAQHSIKPAQKLDLENQNQLNTSDTIGVKMDKDNEILKSGTMFERKPVQLKSSPANYVRIVPIISSNMNSPIYTSYQDRIRESIKERVYANYSKLDRGKVYLTFIISADGSLKAYLIIDEKTNASQNLRYISTKSLKESKFPPFLKGMTLPEYTFNIEIEYQVAD